MLIFAGKLNYKVITYNIRMMKKNLFVLIAILACLNVSAQDNGLNPVSQQPYQKESVQRGDARIRLVEPLPHTLCGKAVQF